MCVTVMHNIYLLYCFCQVVEYMIYKNFAYKFC